MTKQKIIQTVEKIFHPTKVYLVGGSVRDSILGREQHDYDFCIKLEPDMIEKLVKKDGRRAYKIGKRFGTIGFKVDSEMIEVTTFRSEKYEPGNRKPQVTYVKSLNEDLSRRDFTINAMAKRNNRVTDPFGGIDDIKNKVIRCVGNPTERFKEDPLRMLRACRFASQFGFKIEEKTFKQIQKKAHYILDVSKERWVQEIDKLLLGSSVVNGLRLLIESKLLNFMIPDLSLQHNYPQNSRYHNKTLWEHTISVVEATPKDDIILRWAALLHDIGKPFVRTNKKFKTPAEMLAYGKGKTYKSNYIKHELLSAELSERLARVLKFSNERREKVVEMIKHHLEDDCPLREYDKMGKVEWEGKRFELWKEKGWWVLRIEGNANVYTSKNKEELIKLLDEDKK